MDYCIVENGKIVEIGDSQPSSNQKKLPLTIIKDDINGLTQIAHRVETVTDDSATIHIQGQYRSEQELRKRLKQAIQKAGKAKANEGFPFTWTDGSTYHIGMRNTDEIQTYDSVKNYCMYHKDNPGSQAHIITLENEKLVGSCQDVFNVLDECSVYYSRLKLACRAAKDQLIASSYEQLKTFNPVQVYNTILNQILTTPTP